MSWDLGAGVVSQVGEGEGGRGVVCGPMFSLCIIFPQTHCVPVDGQGTVCP